MSLINLIAANQHTPFASTTVTDCQDAIDIKITMPEWDQLLYSAANSVIECVLSELGVANMSKHQELLMDAMASTDNETRRSASSLYLHYRETLGKSVDYASLIALAFINNQEFAKSS